jgi:hypothetical protein
MSKWMLGALALLALGALLRKELPAMKRELKIMRM